MTNTKRDYDSEVAELVALSKQQHALVEPYITGHFQDTEPTLTLSWVTDRSGDGGKSDANA